MAFSLLHPPRENQGQSPHHKRFDICEDAVSTEGHGTGSRHQDLTALEASVRPAAGEMAFLRAP